MNYGGNAQDEMEVTIRLDRKDRQAHISSTWPEWSRKFERLYGSPKKATGRDGRVISAVWVVPLSAIRVRRPTHGRAWTAEQRRAAADRLQKARSSRGRLANTVA
ncbi:MAG: hypothetical protein ACHQ7N_12820 [Candidatus Methylomirabilales bacterium]